MTRTTKTTLGLGIVALLSLGACGGGGDNAGDTGMADTGAMAAPAPAPAPMTDTAGGAGTGTGTDTMRTDTARTDTARQDTTKTPPPGA